MPVAPLPDLNILDAAALRDMVIEQHAQISSHEAEVERLRLIIARLHRLQFGRKSEKIQREIEQLELQLEELEASNAEKREQTEKALAPAAAAIFAEATRKPARRPLPEHLPREIAVHEPEQKGCPECGGSLSKLGEDVSEMLEYVPARFKVVRQVRPKLSCTQCDTIVQAQAPSTVVSPAVSLVPGYWRMFWFRNMRITYRCIDSRKSTPAKVLISSARHSPTGWVRPASY